MAKPMLASATVDFGASRTDIAVPAGTTVAGLLAMLRVDSTDPDLIVTTPDGQPAELASAIGGELPSGVRLLIAGGQTARESATQARLRSSSARFLDLAAATAALLLAGGIGAGVAAPLAMPGLALLPPIRLGLAVLGFVVLVIAARRARLLRHPAGALAVPGLAGLLASAILPPDTVGAGPLALIVCPVVASVGATAVWLRTDAGAAAAAAVVWGVAAAPVGAGILFALSTVQVGAALLCLGVLVLTVAPSFALPVPESQLLDLPPLITSAAAVRAEEVPSPSRITRRRVAGTLEHAAAVTDVGALGGTVIAVVGGLLVLPSVQPGTLPGLAALVALVAAAVTMALLTRDNRSPVVRVAPRAGSAVLTAAICAGLAARSMVSPALVVGGLMLTAGGAVLGTVRITRSQPSPLLGRLADLLQTLSLVVLLPAAVFASGLFDQLWRWAS